MKNLLTCLTLCCLCFATHGANTWYVAANVDDENNDGKSWDHPFASIQKGLSSCANKDTVIVSNGTYVIYSQLEITSQQVNLMSLTGNPADVIIDCRECRGISSSSWKSSVVGVTVQNGRTDTAGAGIRLSTSALVSNCVVRSCSVVSGENDAYGGGIMCQQGSDVVDCLVENCIVSNSTQTSGSYNAQGGGIYNNGTVRSCTVRNCAVYSRNGHYGTSAGGGIYAESKVGENQYPASVIDCTVYSNKVATLTTTYASEGGGVCLRANSGIQELQTVSNCYVFANAAGWSGGGVSLVGNAQLIDCSIVSNKTDNTLGLSEPKPDHMGGGGVFVRGTGGVVRRCLVEGNEITITGSKNVNTQGGGGLRLSGTDISVEDSVIRGNFSNKRGAALYFGATTSDCTFGGGVVSNCWIEANQSDTSGVIAGYEAGGLQIVGCGIVSNVVSDSSALYWIRTKATSGVLFRNTLFAGNRNTGSSTVYGLGLSANAVNSPVAFEFCSFLNESANGGILGQKRETAIANAGNVSVLGCLLYGLNARLNIHTVTNSVVKYTRSENAPVDDPSLGNFNETTDPLFADAANDDYRYAAGSPLLNCNCELQSWMGSGSRNGPQDLGDGTVTLTRSADYGVSVSFNNARPRVSQGRIDIGCFEFYVPKGFIIFFN